VWSSICDARQAAAAEIAAAAPIWRGNSAAGKAPLRNCVVVSSMVADSSAKHVVARQPEPRHGAEIGVAFPLLPRKPCDQHAQIVRPPLRLARSRFRRRRALGFWMLIEAR